MKVDKNLAIMLIIGYLALFLGMDSYYIEGEIDYVKWIDDVRVVLSGFLIGNVMAGISKETSKRAQNFLAYISTILFSMISLYILITTDYVWQSVVILFAFIVVNHLQVEILKTQIKHYTNPYIALSNEEFKKEVERLKSIEIKQTPIKWRKL